MEKAVIVDIVVLMYISRASNRIRHVRHFSQTSHMFNEEVIRHHTIHALAASGFNCKHWCRPMYQTMWTSICTNDGLRWPEIQSYICQACWSQRRQHWHGSCHQQVRCFPCHHLARRIVDGWVSSSSSSSSQYWNVYDAYTYIITNSYICLYMYVLQHLFFCRRSQSTPKNPDKNHTAFPAKTTEDETFG